MSFLQKSQDNSEGAKLENAWLCLLQLGLQEQIDRQGGQVPKKVIDAPFVQIPLGVTEDRLVGTVDIEASMKVNF